MGTITIDSGELLDQSTDDNNTLTEIDTGVMQKKEFSYEMGSVRDDLHFPKSDCEFSLLPGSSVESGTRTESGNKLYIQQTVNLGAATWRSTGFLTAAIYGDFVFEVEIDNFLKDQDFGSDAAHLGIIAWSNASNLISISRVNAPGITNFRILHELAGAWVSTAFTGTSGLTRFIFRITRVGNVWTIERNEYNGGWGGWITQYTVTSAIGTPVRVGLFGVSRAVRVSCDYKYARFSGTGIYWDTKADSSAIQTIYNQQVLSDGAGATINFATANFTEGSNMKYRVKAGTGAWSSFLNAAGIVGLGNVVSDDGKFDIEAQYEGGTAQASWTGVEITTTAPVTGGEKLIGIGSSKYIGSELATCGNGSIFVKKKSGIYVPDKRIKRAA